MSRQSQFQIVQKHGSVWVQAHGVIEDKRVEPVRTSFLDPVGFVLKTTRTESGGLYSELTENIIL